ncbi:MAG: DNA polymerase [Candidatus Nitrosocosmicus sp.]
MIRQEFFPSGPCPASLMIVGEAPGEKEVEKKTPFVGASGWELDKMLSEVGLFRSASFATNVCRVRPAYNDIERFLSDRKTQPDPTWVKRGDLWISPEIVEGISLLEQEIELCRPNVILALGNVALWALTGRWGVGKWRGSVLEVEVAGHRCKVIPTYHPAAVLRQWSMRNTVLHDLRRVKAEVVAPTKIHKVDLRILTRPTFEQVMGFFDNMASLIESNGDTITRIAPDIETRAGHIACIGFAWSRQDAISIPLMCVERAEGFWTPDEENQIIWRIRWLITHPKVLCIGQNWLYDAQYIWRHWLILARNVYDTMIGHHTFWSISQKSLDYQASLYCEDYVYWKDDGKEWDPSVPEDQLWYYNGEDCCRTYECEEGQQNVLKQLTPTWPKLPAIHAFQQQMFHPVLRTMNKGIRPNLALKAKFAERLMGASAIRQAKINGIVGREINISSNKQMCEFFYEELNQKKNWKRPARPGAPMTLTCDDEALEKLHDGEPLLRPLIKIIRELRSIGVFLNTFVLMRLDTDGRIRCSFNIAGTITYRFSSSKNAFGSGTNLQNVPSGDDDEALDLPNVRELFCPDPGKIAFDIDLDSADLQIVTWESNCQWMKQTLAAGKKPYVEIGKEYLRDPTFSKHHKQYKTFKALCHGSNYRGTPPGLASRIGLLVHEVERIQKWYFGLCPEIKAWQEEIEKQVSGRGWVENVFGYRCYFWDRITEKTYNEAVAWKPQSTVGGIINRAYLNIHNNLPWADILLQVHDSLFGQYDAWRGEEGKRAILEQARIPLHYESGDLTIGVGLKMSEISWGDCA